MAREKAFEGIILKKQPYGELDEFVTVFTKEYGKIRLLAKASRKTTSKFAPALVPTYISSLTVSDGNLPKLIHADRVLVFNNIINEPERLPFWYQTSELIDKSVIEDQTNEELYNLTKSFLSSLDILEIEKLYYHSLIFRFKALKTLGMGFNIPKTQGNQTWFSVESGSFGEEPASNSISISNRAFSVLQSFQYNVPTDFDHATFQEINNLLNKFTEYHLDREIKSDKFIF